MPDISKLSGTLVAVVSKVDGVVSANISTVNGLVFGEPEVHVFLLAGQSNMVGRPTFDGGAGYPSGTLQYPKATGYPTYTDTTTIAAAPPLGHWDAQAGDMGLALQFTIDYVSDTGNTVVLIPAADGGTGFVGNHWNPGDAQYNHAVNATNALMAANPDWIFKGILWHQGENDSLDLGFSNETDYSTAFYKMVQKMRIDINEANQETPFILGELLVGGNATDAAGTGNSAVIDNATTYNYRTATVSAAGLPAMDTVHFNAAALRTFGTRYNTAFLSLSNPYPAAETGATGHWLFGRGNQYYIDLTGATNPTENGAAPVHGYNFAELQGANDGLLTSITETSNMTMCYVIKAPNTTILGGTLRTSAVASDGVSMYTSGPSLFFNERGGTGQVGIGGITVSDYYFIALSLDSSDNYVGYIGDATSATVVTGTGPGRNASTRAYGIGDAWYGAAGFDNAFEMCEAIFFDTAKTQSELDDIYSRSVARMSARNITVQ